MVYNHTCQASPPLEFFPSHQIRSPLSSTLLHLFLSRSTSLLLFPLPSSSYWILTGSHCARSPLPLVRCSLQFLEIFRNAWQLCSRSASLFETFSLSFSLHRFTFQPLQLFSRFLGFFSYSFSLLAATISSVLSNFSDVCLSAFPVPPSLSPPFSLCTFRFYDSIVLLLSCLPFISAHNSTSWKLLVESALWRTARIIF